MWIFRVKWPPGSPPAFKARYVARGFNHRQGVDFFHTFSPTLKMTTLRVLLHVAAQRDYELHSLAFSTAFLQGSLYEEIWLRRPPGFTGSFPSGTKWSLWRPVYDLSHAPREWHDTLRTTLAALGFSPSTADPSLFLRTDTSLLPFYVIVYVDDLVFATADTEALAHVKSELQKRHTCTNLGELRSYLGLQITRDRARRTITLTQSHMVHQVLQRFSFRYSSPQSTPLPTGHLLSAPPSDESVEPIGLYLELVGYLMYLMTCTRPDLAYPLSILARYVAPKRHRPEHWEAAKRVLRYLCSTSGMGLVLGGRGPVVLTGHADASWVDDLATQRSSQGYTFSLGSGSVSWRSTRSSSVLSSSCEAEIYAGAMAAQELCWLTYLLTDLGERPRSSPILGRGHGGGGSSGSGGGRPSSRCGALRWGVSCGGQMRVRQRQHEVLTPQQLREWYTSRGSGSGSSGGCSAAVQLGVTCGGMPHLQQSPRETLSPQQLREWYVQRGASRGSARCTYVIRTGDRAGQTCRTVGHTQSRCFTCLSDTWREEFGDATELPRWLELVRQGMDIFTLDYDAILTTMYALSASAEGDCSWCVPRDPGIAAATLGASESGTLPGTSPAEALHTFTLDSGASCCFFRDSTTLTPLPALVPVRLADPSRGPVVARSSTVLPCPAVPSGSQSGLHLPSFSTNLVSTAALQDVMVTTTTPGGQRVSICTCTRTGRHLATFTRWPGSSLCTLATEPSQVAESLPPLPPSLAPPCLPYVEGRQRAAPHSSSFPPMTAPLQTLHMDVWGPALVSGQSRERYFLLSVSSSASGSARTFPVLRLHSDKGGEFSSTLLREFFRGEGILQSFMLPDSPQQNGIAERRIGLVMEVARTSMIHAAAPHFLWPFAVWYAVHQLNLWPRVFLPETSPTLRWTGEVGDASVFRVRGSRAFVRDTSADKLSPRVILCVFLGFATDAPGWLFYHPTSRRIFPSHDITFDESVPFYRLFPYRSAPPLPPPLFLAPGPPPVDPLPPQGPAPSGVSQVDPLRGPAPVQVAVGSGAARGAASGGAEPRGAESEGAETGGAAPKGVATRGAEPGGVATGGGEPGGAEPVGVEPGGAESEGGESGGAEPQGAASSGGFAGALPIVSPKQLREWFVRRPRLRSAASGARGGRTGVAAGAGITGGAATASPGGACTRSIGAAGTGGVEGAGDGDLPESGTTGAGGAGFGGPCAGGVGAGGPCVGGAGAGGAGAVDPSGAVRPRPYFVPLLRQVFGTPPPTNPTPPLLCPPPDRSLLPLQPASPLPAPSPYAEQSGGLTERREPASRPISPVRTARRVPRSRPPPVPGTHAMTLHPSSVPLRVPLPAPPESSLPEVPDPESYRARAASPSVSCLLATAVTDPSFESAAAFALVAEMLDFAAASGLDYATALVAESASASPPSIGGECALGTDVLEDRHEEFECLATALPRFASMMLAPEGDPDAPDIPTPRSYAEAITGPYSFQWQPAMDAEMASWKSRGTYVDEVPPPRANIVDGMWIFRMKRLPGSPPAFKACFVSRGFSQRQGVDYFHTFSPTPKMTTLRVLLHVAAERDYELHSLDFSTAFLQGSLHEEIWLCRPPGFTKSFPAGTQWSLRQPVYGLRQAPREWHDTLRTTLAALGFAPATADPSLFLRTDTSLPPFYVDDLVFATADTEALTLVKLELQKRHTCTDLDELRSYLGLQITRDRARCTITLTQSHMVHQVLQRFGFQFSSPQPIPLSTSHSLSAPLSDESVEPSGPYPELVGCLMYLMTCTRPDLAYPLSLLARYVAPGRHRKELRWLTYLLTDLGEQPRSPPVLYVDIKAMIALCQEHRLEHRTKHIALRYFLARELQQRGQLRLAYVATRANTADVFTKALPPGDHQRFVTVLGLVPTLPQLLTA
ncbi:unnamed protein product [Closterium sp. NIES-54]